MDDGWEFYFIMPRVHVFRNHPVSAAKLGIYKYTEIGIVLDVKVICHHNVHGIEIQTPQHLEITKGCLVMAGSSNRYVDELRHREAENLPEEVAQECVQGQDKEHSAGERSDDHIPIHQRIWEDLSANGCSYGYKCETQVSKMVIKLVRHKHLRERDTDGAIQWTSDSDSKKMKKAISLTEVGSTSSGKQQNKISGVSEFLQQITVTFDLFKDRQEGK